MPQRSHTARRLRPLLLAITTLFGSGAVSTAAPIRGYKVLAKLPHSTANYTEGFFYLDGLFYEGNGLQGHSGVVVTDPETGRVLQRVRLPDEYFGEGIVDWGSELYEWTWKSQLCIVYDRFTLREVRRLHYEGEGWGMTRTARELITSDGTATLRFRNPKTFTTIRQITVRDEGRPVEQLNELEYIHGQIYANVWHSDRIARISPRDGQVIDWIDLSGILPDDQKLNDESVLNGIAYDSKGDRLFVTGKQWPFIFQIEVLTGKPGTK